MDCLKELFTEPLSYDAFCEKVSKSGIKLADLSSGKYVDKGKFAALGTVAEQLKQEKETLTKALETQKRDGAVALALQKAGAKNLKSVLALLDLEKVQLEESGLVGLEEQLGCIKSENSFLFEARPQNTGMAQGSFVPEKDVFVTAARSAAGL